MEGTTDIESLRALLLELEDSSLRSLLEDSLVKQVKREYETPRTYAQRSGIPESHVLHFIRTGQLRAFNSSLGTQRPRWRIPPESIKEFEDSLSNVPKPKRRRSKSEPEVRDYFNN